MPEKVQCPAEAQGEMPTPVRARVPCQARVLTHPEGPRALPWEQLEGLGQACGGPSHLGWAARQRRPRLAPPWQQHQRCPDVSLVPRCTAGPSSAAHAAHEAFLGLPGGKGALWSVILSEPEKAEKLLTWGRFGQEIS